MATLLPVAEAAQALGISVSALRRGLKSGRYQGRRQETPQGFTWRVEVGDRVSDRVGDGRVGDRVGGAPSPDTPTSPGMALQTARAAEMAQYTAALLEPLHARLEAQAQEIGKLKEQLAAARTHESAAPEWPERRSWWQRLWTG